MPDLSNQPAGIGMQPSIPFFLLRMHSLLVDAPVQELGVRQIGNWLLGVKYWIFVDNAQYSIFIAGSVSTIALQVKRFVVHPKSWKAIIQT